MRRSKQIWILLSLAFGLYSGTMIILRLQMTELAYTFDELKSYERSLQEEQTHLRAELSERLSAQRVKLKGYTAPEPKQVIRIP